MFRKALGGFPVIVLAMPTPRFQSWGAQNDRQGTGLEQMTCTISFPANEQKRRDSESDNWQKPCRSHSSSDAPAFGSLYSPPIAAGSAINATVLSLKPENMEDALLNQDLAQFAVGWKLWKVVLGCFCLPVPHLRSCEQHWAFSDVLAPGHLSESFRG